MGRQHSLCAQREELEPGRVIVNLGDEEKGEVAVLFRGSGWPKQLHVSLLWCVPSFAAVARLAGADQVFPGVSAPQIAGRDVIQGKVSGLSTTVLAGVFVPDEDLAAGKFGVEEGGFDHLAQADDRWIGKGMAGTAQEAETSFHHLRLAPMDENHRPPHAAEVKGNIVLV